MMDGQLHLNLPFRVIVTKFHREFIMDEYTDLASVQFSMGYDQDNNAEFLWDQADRELLSQHDKRVRLAYKVLHTFDLLEQARKIYRENSFFFNDVTATLRVNGLALRRQMLQLPLALWKCMEAADILQCLFPILLPYTKSMINFHTLLLHWRMEIEEMQDELKRYKEIPALSAAFVVGAPFCSTATIIALVGEDRARDLLNQCYTCRFDPLDALEREDSMEIDEECPFTISFVKEGAIFDLYGNELELVDPP